MNRSAEIAMTLTEAWVRAGVSQKGPKEVADFYWALYHALDAPGGKTSSLRASDKVAQLISGGLLLTLIVIWIVLAALYK